MAWISDFLEKLFPVKQKVGFKGRRKSGNNALLCMAQVKN